MSRQATKSAKPEKTSTAKGINKVLVALLAAAIVLLVQQWGQPDAQPEAAQPPHGDMSGMTSDMTNFESLDTDRVGELETQLENDPDDLGAKRELAELHNNAGLWDEAAEYHRAVLEQEPADVDALLAIGVIEFNLGDVEAAETTWLQAVDVDPTLPEPYFNLGFAYLGQEPAQADKAVEAWEKLIEVAPDSSLAQTAKTHIDGIAGD